MRKLRLIVDTNIFVRSLFFQKMYFHCKTLVDILKNENIDLVFTQDTVGELFYMVKTFIQINKVNRDDGLIIMNKVSEIFYNSVIVNTRYTIAPKCEDMFDDMFLKCYVESHADYIITDDFKSGMNKVANIKVLESKKFIQKIVKGEFEGFGIIIGK